MARELAQYRVTCVDDGRDYYVTVKNGAPAPTACPVDANHQVAKVTLHAYQDEEAALEQQYKFARQGSHSVLAYDGNDDLESVTIWTQADVSTLESTVAVAVVGGSSTTLEVASIPAGTPTTGGLWLERDGGGYDLVEYSSYTGTIYTLTAAAPNNADIGNEVRRAVKLFTRTLTYSNGELATVQTVDEQTGQILTTTLGYSGGDLESVDKSIS